MSSGKRVRRASARRRILDDEAQEYVPSDDELESEHDETSHDLGRVTEDAKEEVDAGPSTPAARDPAARDDAGEEFSLDDFDTHPSQEVEEDHARKMRRMGNAGEVSFLLYYRMYGGRKVPLGFSIANSGAIVQQLKEHVADPVRGHYRPFFINREILKEKRLSRLPEGWHDVAWYHAAKSTIEAIADVIPFMQSYQEMVAGLGYGVRTTSLEVLEEDEAIWARLAPPPHRLKKLGGAQSDDVITLSPMRSPSSACSTPGRK